MVVNRWLVILFVCSEMPGQLRFLSRRVNALQNIFPDPNLINNELIEECRDSDVPCDNIDCQYYDVKFDQSCSGHCNEWPAIATCKEYKPLEV